MKTDVETKDIGTCKDASFSNTFGEERFFAFEAPVGMNFVSSVEALFDEYNSLLESAGLSCDTEVYLRFHLSDISNQAETLIAFLKERDCISSCSMVGQPPVSGSKIAVEGYHIKKKKGIIKEQVASNTIFVNHGVYQSLYTNCRPDKIGPSYQQTQQLFGSLSHMLNQFDSKIDRDVLRTWIYVRDVDNNYQGMVDARRELFEIIGMTKDTHYIASTGIEGCSESTSNLVIMDALAVLGLDPKQITYMNAPDNLCPTYEYNVTFERATRVMFGDRSHYYISGTASIDREGNVLHVGNVERQTRRTLDNVRALLTNYGADLTDLKILIVYLRDVSDAPFVHSFLKDKVPANLPYIVVRGSVCRPTWLVEMEGIAVNGRGSNDFSPFV